jgi:MFS family permease
MSVTTRNIATNLCESSLCMLGFGFIGFQTFVPVFVSLFTDSKLLIGLVGTAVPAGWLLPQVLIAPWVESLEHKKPMVVRLALFEKILYLGLAGLAFASGRFSADLTVALVVLISFLIGLAGGVTRVGWGELMASILPPGARGRYFGAVSFIGGILGALGAYLGGLILARVAPPANYGFTFLAGCAVILFSWTFLLWIREPPPEASPRRRSQREYLRDIAALIGRDRAFTGFVAAQSVAVLGGMGYYFIAVFSRARLALDGAQLGLLAASMLIGSTLASPVFGWFGDRFGHRAALQISAMLQAIGFVLAMTAVTPAAVLAAGFAIGTSRASAFVNAQPLVFSYAPVMSRPTYIGVSSTAFGAATMVAPFLGGIVAQAWGHPALLALSSLLSLAAVAAYRSLAPNPHAEMERPGADGRVERDAP